jgi:hypothetical protein
MSYIKPIQDDILDEANSREPADRFIYLLELHQLLKTRARLIINTLTHEDCTAEIQSWLLEILHKELVPPNYIDRSTANMLASVHPFHHDLVTQALVQEYRQMTLDQARTKLRLDFTEEQFQIVFNQLQVWIAMHEPCAGGVN